MRGLRPKAFRGFWAAFLAGKAIGQAQGFAQGMGATMKVVTKWPALVPAIRRAGHEPVVELARCGPGYCTSEGPSHCVRRPRASVTCENFTYNEKPQ